MTFLKRAQTRRYKHHKEVIMKLKIMYSIPLVISVLGLCACQTVNMKSKTVMQEARWYNVNAFEGVDSIGTNPYDLEFDLEYSGIDGSMLNVKNCLEVLSLGDNKILEREFVRWNLLKNDCEVAKRFYDSPERAFSYWPSEFDLSLLKTFPSTSTPYLGGQTLDGRIGSLGSYEPTLNLIESGKHNVKVSYNGMVVNYVVMARGDFNRDGYQDLFVRMDWYIEDAFGDGSDWIALTKMSPNTPPMLLWRK